MTLDLAIDRTQPCFKEGRLEGEIREMKKRVAVARMAKLINACVGPAWATADIRTTVELPPQEYVYEHLSDTEGTVRIGQLITVNQDTRDYMKSMFSRLCNMAYHRSIGKSIDEKEASQIEDGLAGGMAGQAIHDAKVSSTNFVRRLDTRKANMGIPNLMSHFADFRSTGSWHHS
ncbi:hypothetical protein LTS10_005992 [Elasticomyces elasticus]|nr:hypothetical protein LTS10_005992 [Elasticomyces elasticus]